MTEALRTPVAESGKPKLLDQVRQRCRVRHLAYQTEQVYVNWVRRFVLFHHVRHPLEMGAKEVGEFLTHLAVEGRVAASTQNQALSALLFLYREVLERDFGWLDDVVRAKKPKRLPVVFTPEEAMAIVEELEGQRWLMGMLLYGGGLRLMECLRGMRTCGRRRSIRTCCGRAERFPAGALRTWRSGSVSEHRPRDKPENSSALWAATSNGRSCRSFDRGDNR